MWHIAHSGKTVICTIHQPSSDLFQMFDRILLMTDGRVAFLGNPADALTFFSSHGFRCPSNYNPADFFIETLAVVPGQEAACKNKTNFICDSYESSEFRHQLEKIINEESYSNGKGHFFKKSINMSPYKANWLDQFRAVFRRSWLNNVRDLNLHIFRFANCIVRFFLNYKYGLPNNSFSNLVYQFVALNNLQRPKSKPWECPKCPGFSVLHFMLYQLRESYPGDQREAFSM